MKHDINIPIPLSWNDITLDKFKSDICTRLISKKKLGEEEYVIGWFSLSKNAGIMSVDKNPQDYYPPSSSGSVSL